MERNPGEIVIDDDDKSGNKKTTTQDPLSPVFATVATNPGWVWGIELLDCNSLAKHEQTKCSLQAPVSVVPIRKPACTAPLSTSYVMPVLSQKRETNIDPLAHTFHLPGAAVPSLQSKHPPSR